MARQCATVRQLQLCPSCKRDVAHLLLRRPNVLLGCVA